MVAARARRPAGPRELSVGALRHARDATRVCTPATTTVGVTAGAAGAEVGSVPAMNVGSVLARIAVPPGEANDAGMRGLRFLACGVALATLTALTIGLLQVLEVVPSDQEEWIPLAIYPFLALAILSPAVVGLLIALQLPRNPIAWILLLGALVPTFQIAAEQLVGAAWAYQTEAATMPPALFAWPLAVAFVFPDGRLLSRRWRWVAGMAIASFAFTIGLKLFDPEPYPAPNEDITNPLLGNAVGEFIIDTGLWIPFAIGVLVSPLAGALAVILRFRRSVGVERLQMKWLVWGASLIALVLPLDIVMSSWFGGGGAKTFALLLVAQLAFVAAIGSRSCGTGCTRSIASSIARSST